MFNFVFNSGRYIDIISNPEMAQSYLSGALTIEDTDKFIFNKVTVFYNKGEIEVIGGSFFNPNTPEKVEYIGEFIDGSNSIFFRRPRYRKDLDPILQFEGILRNRDVIKFESSKFLRRGVGSLDSGSNFEQFDRPSKEHNWLGRSWIEGGDEVELYFLVESRTMLDEVATYYDLPVPYDDVMKHTLDNDLKSIRFKSYDLNQEGRGNFVAVVVAGITFKDNIATTLKLYATTR